MAVIHARQALLTGGWARDVRIGIVDGRIATLETGAAPAPGDERHDTIVAGMPNLHSHAFQRGMAGLAETRGPGSDSFWSWRNVMYRFALSMTPDDVEAVAAQLYVEMLGAGYTRVGEFHYLHHDKDGGHYGDIAEMAARIAAAASTTGIALTLLPVFYAHAGFGGTAPGEGQRRFINDRQSYARLLERCRALTDALPAGITGVAPDAGGVLFLCRHDDCLFPVLDIMYIHNKRRRKGQFWKPTPKAHRKREGWQWPSFMQGRRFWQAAGRTMSV